MSNETPSNNDSSPPAQNYKGRVVWYAQFIKRKFEQRRARKRQQNSIDKAAESTARATWALVIFTFVLAVIGYLQYTIISGQLVEMKSSSDQVERSISAATIQAKTAEKTFSLVQRPYIALEDNLKIEDISTDEAGRIQFNVIWTNSGNIPATVEFRGAGGADFAYHDVYKTEKWILGPHSKLKQIVYYQWPWQIVDVYIKQKLGFRVIGWARYADQFGETRQTQFCVLIDQMKVDLATNRVSGKPIPCEEPGTNCIDDECPVRKWPEN